MAYSSRGEAAASMGWTPSAFRRALSELRMRAARRGWLPTAPREDVPEGFHVLGTTSLYKAGSDAPALRWVKTRADEESKYRLLMEAMTELALPFRGLSEVSAAPVECRDDLLVVYPLGDPHLGMYAWSEETGANFDLETAEAGLVSAVDHLVGLVPRASSALIISLGDFYHADSVENRTRASGNVLDVDTRWGKVLAAGIRTMRRCIDVALVRHASVRVICEIGNHDDHSAVMLALCLAEYYANQSRVSIDTSPCVFHYHEFGKTLIGVTHGHRTKPANLPIIMAKDCREAWGRTHYRYWYTGHVHQDSVREYGDTLVETFRTLAPRDAWGHGQGYRSGQDLKADVIHAEYGRINRHVVGIRQIWDGV